VPFATALATATTPTPSPTPTDTSTPEPTSPFQGVTQQLVENPCGAPPNESVLCRAVLEWTDSEWLAASSHWLIAKPLAVLAIVAVAVLVRALLHRGITKLARRAASGTVPGAMASARAQMAAGVSLLVSERRKQRAETMASVLRSLTTAIIVVIAILMVLAELELNIGPLLAGAGIVGLAVGFGAQTLVKDFLSGMFMILEDEYGVGDVVDLGEASGSVESVGLRATRVRDVNGTVWYVRNGEIIRVGNMSQGWARVVIDVGVAYNEDIMRVRDLLQLTAHELAEDEKFRDVVLEEPEVWGVEALSADAVVVRVVVKTVPLKQWDVARALRERIKTAFNRHGVEIPFPQRSIWVRTEGPGAETRVGGLAGRDGAETGTETGTPPPRG
jgi:small-conductance mechanosensitive channel